MNPRAIQVETHPDHTMNITFANGEVRMFDMRPYLNHGIFSELQDLSYFHSARIQFGTITWPHDQDVCPDTLYEESVPVEIAKKSDR